MTKPKIVAGIALLLIGGAFAALAIAWRPAIQAIEPPALQSFDANLVKRGRDLAAVGNCNDCHTVRGGKAFAGGLAVPTPFGAIYSSNITPDPETGIGRWSEAAFRRAMRSGVDRAGHHLYPTFPYDHFTNVTDEDDHALYAFLMTRKAVHAPARANELSFPFNQRFIVAGWKLLFLRHEAFQPDSAQSAEWNRGAYLVEGLAHCGACHTPRNALGAERLSASFSGGDVDNWHAYAINARSLSPLPWNTEALFHYLRQGWDKDHGVARGPMAEVVSNLSSVQESDVHAIAVYMTSVFGPPSQDQPPQGRSSARANQIAAVTSRLVQRGRRIDLCRRLCGMPRIRQAVALWRRQSRPEHRAQRARPAQRRQHHHLRHPAHRRRAQPDHAGFWGKYDRRPDRGLVELSARPLQQPSGLDRR